MVLINKPLKEIEREVRQSLIDNPLNVENLLIMEQIMFKYYLDYQSALKLLKQILSIQADCIDARLDLIQIVIDFKLVSYQDCFRLLDECLQQDQSYWRIYFTKIRILDTIGNKDEQIIKIINKCMQAYPNNKYFEIYNAQILSDQQANNENLVQQLLSYRNSIDLDFDLLRRISYSLGNLKKGKEAIEFIEKAIKLNPNSYISYNEFAYLERVLNKNNEKSLEYCLKSIELNPKYTTSLNNLAATYKNLNKIDECIKCLKRTLELNCNPYAYHQIIYDYYEINNMDLAKYYSLKNVQKLKNDYYSNYLLQKIYRKLYSIKIDDYESQELQSIKCLKFNEIHFQNDEFYQLNTSINEVYENQ